MRIIDRALDASGLAEVPHGPITVAQDSGNQRRCAMRRRDTIVRVDRRVCGRKQAGHPIRFCSVATLGSDQSESNVATHTLDTVPD